MGFSVPRRLRSERWALTPPFHPCRCACPARGAAEGTQAVCFLWHCPSGRLAASPPACILLAPPQGGRRLRGIVPCGVRTFLSRPQRRERYSALSGLPYFTRPPLGSQPRPTSERGGVRTPNCGRPSLEEMSKPRVRVEPVAGGKGVVERLIGQTALGGGGFPEKVAPCGQGRILGLSDDKARGEGHAPQRASNRAGFKGLSCLRAPPGPRRHRGGQRPVPAIGAPPAGPTAPPPEHHLAFPRDPQPSQGAGPGHSCSSSSVTPAPPRFRKPERTGAMFRARSGAFKSAT